MSSSDQKYHINSAGDVRPCNARKKTCRFGSTDHFQDRDEGLREVERRLAEESESNVLKGVRKKSKAVSVAKNNETKSDTSERFAKVRREILDMASKVRPSKDDLIRIGEKFDSEVKSRLSFNIDSDELSNQNFAEIQKVNREVFSSLVKNGDPAKNVEGRFKKQLNEAVAILPNNVKESLDDAPILTKTVNKTNKSRDGYHVVKNLEFSKPALTSINSFYFQESIPASGVMPLDGITPSEINNPGTSFSAAIKDGEKLEGLKRVWIGKPLQKKGFKKISDTSEVYLNGVKHTLDKPMYSTTDSYFITGSEIGSKIYSDEEEQKSVLLHEYCHAVQYRSKVNGFEEKEMFDSIAGEKTFDWETHEIVHKGFPNGYMGLRGGKELLPVATEGVFYPGTGDRRFFYGSDKGENAQKVRNWVTGYWLSMSQR